MRETGGVVLLLALAGWLETVVKEGWAWWGVTFILCVLIVWMWFSTRTQRVLSLNRRVGELETDNRRVVQALAEEKIMTSRLSEENKALREEVKELRTKYEATVETMKVLKESFDKMEKRIEELEASKDHYLGLFMEQRARNEVK